MAGKPRKTPRKTVRKRPLKRRLRPRALRDPAVGVGENATLSVLLPEDATAEDIADAQQQLDTLEANGQIARADGPLPPGATHQIKIDPDGTRRLVRRRFSAT